MAVYQRKDKNGKVIKNKKGCSWYYRCYYTDMYGNRKQFYSKMYKSSHEASDAEDEFLIKVKNSDIVDKNTSFEDVYNEWWFYKSRSLKETVIYNIKNTLDRNILDFFKEYKLHSIKNNSINFWYDYLDKKNLCIAYQNTIIGYFKEFLTYACNNYEFDSKILSKIVKKKNSKVKENIEKEENYWTNDEFNTFISKIDNELYFLLFSFLYYTGVRIGECLALKWSDINFNNCTFSITKSYCNKIGNNGYILSTPKTKNSIREVDLDDELLLLLKNKYKKDKMIIDFTDDMFVFGTTRPISPTSVSRHFDFYYKHCENLKHISIHGFRHSHVSLLINLGCDSRDVAKRIGDTVEVVEKHYYHMFPQKKSVTVNVLNNFKLNNKK